MRALTGGRGDALAAGVIAAAVVLLYLLLPRQGDIWWMDASRNALNGAFFLDFFHAMPLRRPMDFAMDYYRQWPALTIGFYPPVFHLMLAASFAAFGVSEAAALVPELICLGVLGWGAYRLSRHWLAPAPAPALAAALLLIGAPEVSYWGRQIMLDVPAYMFLIWAVEYQVRFVKGGSAWALYAAVLCAVLSVGTKYNAAFILAVMAVSLIAVRGWRFAIGGTALRAAVLGIVLLLPVVAIFLKFAAYNLDQAASVQGYGVRWSFSDLTFYARAMPAIVSWPTLVLALVYAAAVPFVPRLRLPREDAVLLLTWLVLGYAFYTMIAVKEPRHILFVTYPIVLAAVLLLDRGLPVARGRALVPLALACGVFAWSAAARPPPYVTGMRAAAEAVAKLAPPESNVAFWGRLDGSFIFSLRAGGARPDLGVIRLDKVLLGDVAVALERGFTQSDMTAAQIVDRLAALHVQYVVVQDGYGEDIAVIQRLHEALKSEKFVEVQRIPATSNYVFPYLGDLVVYRAVAPVPPGRVTGPMELKLIGRSF